MKTIAEHAAVLSNLRNRLHAAAGEADRASAPDVQPEFVRGQLRALIGTVDDVYDGLREFAFPESDEHEALLALTRARNLAALGDAEGAGRVLVEAFAPAGEVAA